MLGLGDVVGVGRLYKATVERIRRSDMPEGKRRMQVVDPVVAGGEVVPVG